jgi:hypothetical protein
VRFAPRSFQQKSRGFFITFISISGNMENSAKNNTGETLATGLVNQSEMLAVRTLLGLSLLQTAFIEATYQSPVTNEANAELAIETMDNLRTMLAGQLARFF